LEQQYLNMNVESYSKLNDQLNNVDLISYGQEREAFIHEIKRLENELTEKDKNCTSNKEQLFDLQQVC
jgi:hypothetical protein